MVDNQEPNVPIEEQLAFFDANVDSVDLEGIFLDIISDAKELARERMERYYPKYGDGNFHKTTTQLRIEQMEEIADAINYEIFKKYRKSKGLS